MAGQVVEAYPNDALAYALLGSAYYNIGRSDEATKHLKRCLELRPDQVGGLRDSGASSLRKGRTRGNRTSMPGSAEARPGDPGRSESVGSGPLDLGQTEEAVHALQQAVRLPKPTSESCYLLGQAHMQSGDLCASERELSAGDRVVARPHPGVLRALHSVHEVGANGGSWAVSRAIPKIGGDRPQDLTDRSAREDTLTGLPMVRETVARTFSAQPRSTAFTSNPERRLSFFASRPRSTPTIPFTGPPWRRFTCSARTQQRV